MAPKYRTADNSLGSTPHHIRDRRRDVFGDAQRLWGDSGQQEMGGNRRQRPDPHAQILLEQSRAQRQPGLRGIEETRRNKTMIGLICIKTIELLFLLNNLSPGKYISYADVFSSSLSYYFFVFSFNDLISLCNYMIDGYLISSICELNLT